MTQWLRVLIMCRMFGRHRPKMANSGRCITCNKRVRRR